MDPLTLGILRGMTIIRLGMQIVSDYETVINKARAEGRDPTPEEREAAKVKSDAAYDAALKALNGEPPLPPT